MLQDSITGWMVSVHVRSDQDAEQQLGRNHRDNSFGTHEFLNLCEMLGCEPYISGNVGSGNGEELAKWVEYMTSDGDTPWQNSRQNGRDKAWKVKYLGGGKRKLGMRWQHAS